MVNNLVPSPRLLRVLIFVAVLVPVRLVAHAQATDAGATTRTAPSRSAPSPPVAPPPAAPPPAPPNTGFAPDPPPMVTRHQWVLDLSYESGALASSGARRIELPKPTATPRLMGRFAVELYIGKELLERVRFDFPLLGADESAGQRRRWDAPPSFERHLSSRAGVMVPHSERATRALVIDRASGRSWDLAWPPAVGSADGGVPLTPTR